MEDKGYFEYRGNFQTSKFKALDFPAIQCLSAALYLRYLPEEQSKCVLYLKFKVTCETHALGMSDIQARFLNVRNPNCSSSSMTEGSP